MVDLHKDKDTSNRFEKMCNSLIQKIREEKPDIVVLEDVVLMRNPQVVKLLARL